MILVEEVEPVDTVLLVRSKLCLDGDAGIWNGSTFFRVKSWPMKVRSRSRPFSSSSDRPGGSGMPASSGTSLTRVANDVVAIRRISLSESLIRPSTGTMRKMTYGRMASPMTAMRW